MYHRLFLRVAKKPGGGGGQGIVALKGDLTQRRGEQGKEGECSNQTLTDFLTEAHIQMHGTKLNHPDWSYDSHSLAFTARDPAGGMLHVMINGYWQPLAFEVPLTAEEGRWRRWIDTFRASPEDICAENEAPVIAGSTYLVQPRSIVCLLVQPHAVNPQRATA